MCQKNQTRCLESKDLFFTPKNSRNRQSRTTAVAPRCLQGSRRLPSFSSAILTCSFYPLGGEMAVTASLFQERMLCFVCFAIDTELYVAKAGPELTQLIITLNSWFSKAGIPWPQLGHTAVPRCKRA